MTDTTLATSAPATPYRAPLRDIRFTLEHVTPLPQLLALEAHAHLDEDMVRDVLEELGRFATKVVAPTNRDGDLVGARLVDGAVETPPSFKEVYRQYVQAGWGAIQLPTEWGGGGLPETVGIAIREVITSGNMAFALGPLLAGSAVHALGAHASPEQQETYLPKLISGEWMSTMNLTEPHAGSDVGNVRTRAVPAGDGSYRITGQKIFITYGDHDLTEQIVHLVLARLPEAPPGTKGISLFIVPKYLVNPDGSLGPRNDVKAVGLEHKLGIHGSPTCVMAYGGDDEGAVGYLVGRPHGGMRAMFTMMNDARLGVGQQGVSIAERAYQQALAYAQERRQGRGPGGGPEDQVPIINHPDVRRMLLTQKATIEAGRALCYTTAHAIDLAAHAPDPQVKERQRKVADLLTPLAKAWGTDNGVEMTSIALQVHGGMGYIEETGVAQHYRDARIAPIYEGTNGIQALDLVGRKLPYDGGAFVQGYLAELRAEIDTMPQALSGIADGVRAGLAGLEQATQWVFSRSDRPADVLAGATPYLRLFATVVGGALLARGATAAHRLLESGSLGGYDEAFLRGKITTAHFFAGQLLPPALGLVPAITAGADDLYAVDAAALAP